MLYALALGVMLLGAINYSLSLGHALVFLLGGLGMMINLGLVTGAIPAFNAMRLDIATALGRS